MNEDEPFRPAAAPPAGAHGRPRRPRGAQDTDRDRLKIGYHWNGIRILALSQSNPLKAIAEFVENSIDAHAKTLTITRGGEHGEHDLSIRADGDGVSRDEDGTPNFRYVGTHICDSITRRLKSEATGSDLQGEFDIGLLPFWTVGDELTMVSTGTDQRSYQSGSPLRQGAGAEPLRRRAARAAARAAALCGRETEDRMNPMQGNAGHP